ncbi:odorant receptor 59a-like [Epargyreus clarus]|uniref:odorant receptor 59a-like n=1 Tax=Epargyreus clarus TaxID=520877 RepID=UPI003C2F1A85
MKIYKQIDCFSYNLKFWKYLGICPFSIKSPLYKYYSIIFIIFYTITYDVLCAINLYFIPRHIDDFIEELIFFFTEIAEMSKVLTFFFMSGKIKDILNTLESDMFQPETAKGINIIERAKTFNIRYWKIVGAVSTTSYLVHVMSPFLAHLILKVKLILPICSFSFLSDSVKEKFIYPLFFYQCSGMHFVMLYNVNIDTFFLGLMIFLIAQLEILGEKFTVVADCNEILENRSQTDPQRIDMELIKKLNKAFIHYDEVRKFCNLIQEVFSVTLFVQFSMASCIICICLVRFTMPAPWQYYIFLTTYMFIMIIQIMVPCFFGARIMDKSCLLSQAIYTCDWIPRSKQFKSSMRFFVEHANQPLTIIGWKMFPLSLITFTSIMNSAYSFFTLLRHMQSR